MHVPTVVLGILILPLVAALTNFTIDNTSPLVVFSPTPCFEQDTSSCSQEWQLFESTSDYNGSSTTTTGPNAALGLTVVPRVSLVFQGSSVIFVPGQHSTAQATVVVDNLSSILVDTSANAFSGTGLDPSTNHTITITFVPSDDLTTLEVDYFLIELPDANTTSTASSTLIPTPFPTALPSTPTPTPLPTSLPPSSSFTSTLSHHPPPTAAPTPSNTIPTGTIAAVTVSGALLLLLSALAWFLTLRRRRRRAALRREKAILYDLRLPSEHITKEHSLSRVRRWGEEQLDRLRDRDRSERGQGAEGTELPWDGAARREKGKERERPTWRDSALPPVHYTPWR